MDGITLSAVAADLSRNHIGARIEKIYQPERDELLLHLRGGERLLLSAHPSHTRAQFTKAPRKNPEHPPMFCMALRKHLTGARISSVSQPGFERVLRIDLRSFDELGEETTFSLIAETMGRHSNVILLRENGLILDSIVHVTPAISSQRNVLPGLRYEAPPAQNKRNPIEDCDAQSILRALDGQTGPLDKVILHTWSGFSPVFAREAALRAAPENPQWEVLTSAQKAGCVEKIHAFFSMLRTADFSPTLIRNDFGEAIACFPFTSVQYSQEFQQSYDSIHEALDEFYTLRDASERIKQKGASLHRLLSHQIERCYKKLSIQQDILSQADKLAKIRLHGELLMANAYKLPRGLDRIQLENYYDESMPTITIPIDPKLSPMDNAQKYFKRYHKSKAALGMAQGQIESIQRELDYLEGQIDNLRKCSEESELLEIRAELAAQGYMKPDRFPKGRKPGKVQKRQKLPGTKPLHYLSSDGADIYIGKNNAQNENLTLRFASADDLWLHTKNIPGSHVIVRTDGEPSEQTLREAAQLAAYYSKARQSAQVPVDYTPRKYIKKPGGSPPGFVVYSTNRTLYVTPNEGLIRSLRQV